MVAYYCWPSKCTQGETPNALVKVLSITLVKGRWIAARYNIKITPPSSSWALVPQQGPGRPPTEGATSQAQDAEPINLKCSRKGVRLCPQQTAIEHWGEAGSNLLAAGRVGWLVGPRKAAGSERAQQSHTQASLPLPWHMGPYYWGHVVQVTLSYSSSRIPWVVPDIWSNDLKKLTSLNVCNMLTH